MHYYEDFLGVQELGPGHAADAMRWSMETAGLKNSLRRVPMPGTLAVRSGQRPIALSFPFSIL